jgi:hypothetical protein
MLVKVLKAGGLMTKRRNIGRIVSLFVAYFSVAGIAATVTLPELASRVENMSRTEREALLIKEEKEVMFYGTTSVSQVAVLRKSFNARYPFVELKQFYGVRQVIFNKAMSEFRSGANLADVLMTDVSYGSLFIKEGISHPYTTPDVKRYVRGSYDENGHDAWRGG